MFWFYSVSLLKLQQKLILFYYKWKQKFKFTEARSIWVCYNLFILGL